MLLDPCTVLCWGTHTEALPATHAMSPSSLTHLVTDQHTPLPLPLPPPLLPTCAPHRPDLLLVMLPSRSPALYQEVKVATDAALGVPSQVLVAPVAGVGSGAQPRGRLQYCNNLGERHWHTHTQHAATSFHFAARCQAAVPVLCPWMSAA